MPTEAVFIDRFSVGLDDLTRKQQRDPLTVARVLAEHGKFSVFEATDNNVIAGTMDKLVRNGWFTTDPDHYGYPWTKVTLTAQGRAALGVMPKRIQRRRSKGWRMPEGAVYVGRPTKWGNPATVTRDDSGERRGWWVEYANIPRRSVARAFCSERREAHGLACALYREHVEAEQLPVHELRGKDLVCWCRLDMPCHVDVLLEIANAE